MKNVLWIGLMPPGKGAPYLRKKFTLDAVPRKVKCRIAGVGFYELYLNGRKVGDGRLEPLPTRYDVRVLYREFEVSDYLTVGENLCEIHLGNGWYAGKYADIYGSNYASYRHISKAALKLFTNKITLLETSEDWEAAASPVLHDSPRTGETFDAGMLDKLNWVPAWRLMPPGGKLCKHTSAPVTLQEPIESVRVVQEKDSVFCYDFGVNLTGTVELAVQGSAGSQVILRYGELFDQENGFSQKNIDWYLFEGEFQTDRYILRGDKTGECWIPAFSYHGFRYVQVTLEGDAKILSLKALPLRSSFQRRGKITCSHIDLNRLLEITERSLTSNFVGYPSDCPHREKNGWLADAHLAADSMLVWYDAAENYRDFIDIIFDYQRPSGQLPGMALGSGHGWHWDFGPVWTIAPILLADKCYMLNGNLQIIKQHFAKMAKYMDFCAKLRRNGLIEIGPAEWKLFDGSTVRDGIIDSALIAYCSKVMSKFARLLNKPAWQQHFEELYQNLRGKLQQTQAEHVSELSVLLCCGMGTRADAVRLDEIVRQKQYCACFGITGAKYVPRALAEYGFIDTAFKMFTQHQYPGWQWMLDHGATTLWENFQGNESLNHPMMGDVAAWAVRYLAGIKPLESAFKKFEFAPQIPQDLQDFHWEYHLPNGIIAAGWQKLSGNRIEYRLTVPEGSTAIVYDQTNKPRAVTAGTCCFIK